MQQTISQDTPACRATVPLRPTIKVFTACENQAGFLQAGKVQAQVEALCGDEVEISSVFWNFALLRHEDLREHAVLEAAAADMIVISLAGGHELPAHVRDWAERWPPRAPAGRVALVTLVGQDYEAWGEWRSNVAYLRQIAENNGLDFFCNRDGWDRLAPTKPTLAGNAQEAVISNPIVFRQLFWGRGSLND